MVSPLSDRRQRRRCYEEARRRRAASNMADSRERRGTARLQPPVVSSVKKGSGDSYTESSETQRGQIIQCSCDGVAHIRFSKQEEHLLVKCVGASQEPELLNTTKYLEEYCECFVSATAAGAHLSLNVNENLRPKCQRREGRWSYCSSSLLQCGENRTSSLFCISET